MFKFRAEEIRGDLVKYMEMSESDYLKLKKQYLPKGINSLFQFIHIGDVVELQGLNPIIQTSTIMELPSKEIESKLMHRYH